VVWGEILVGTAILLAGLDAPLVLLIAQSINGMVMVLYCALLIKLNRSVLPHPARTGGARTGVMVWAVLFYGFFSAALVLSIFRCQKRPTRMPSRAPTLRIRLTYAES
jgi:hypothetical protein